MSGVGGQGYGFENFKSTPPFTKWSQFDMAVFQEHQPNFIFNDLQTYIPVMYIIEQKITSKALLDLLEDCCKN